MRTGAEWDAVERDVRILQGLAMRRGDMSIGAMGRGFDMAPLAWTPV